jgi:hypothetical protein
MHSTRVVPADLSSAAQAALKHPDDPAAQAAVTDRWSELRATTLEDYIRRAVDAAPPLTDEQRARLARLLSPISISDVDGHCCGSYGVDQLAKGIGCPQHNRRPE